MTTSKAAERWLMKDRTIRAEWNLEKFPKGTIRKFGKTWIVTKEGMEAVFGPEPK
ncbi:helix-turn-helix domain-containing protein [Priestia flexa]|uniref:helix-turn-helix domain-containing protein n=1 Tax=Priestia flexa TaxID=86664 RepID=UPI0024937D3E|nr:helix-turn-helix domain-containing protein [Priestia flexa]